MGTAGVGSVVAVHRYPVKSMMGEEVNASRITERGLVGDRGYAFVDRETGKVVSAKEPRKWSRMFEFRAAYVEPPDGNGLPPVQITLPDGAIVRSDEPVLAELVSGWLGREVSFGHITPEAPSLEEYWPDIEELDFQDTVTDEAMLSGTFFDAAAVHVLTTSTLERLREHYPQGRFEVRRFRPNLVVDTSEAGFVENEWVGKRIAVGDEVVLEVVKPCPRCVMTTLPQGDLPKDPGILRAAAQQNDANVGVYAAVVQGGAIRRGDPVGVV